MFKWKYGRQGSGYRKLLIFSNNILKCDMYILHIPTGVAVPTHTDTVPGYKHNRLNIYLKQPLIGGYNIICGKTRNHKRFVKFRPDIEPHSVTKIDAGEVYILSIGWLTK